MHLLKSQVQPEKQTRSWLLNIRQQRREIVSMLEQSPSLLSLLETELPELYSVARQDAETETGLETFPVQNPFTLHLILNG